MTIIWVLDTDHLSLFQREHPTIQQRINQINFANTAITVVTLEEQMKRWLNVINKYNDQPSQSERLILAYKGLRDGVEENVTEENTGHKREVKSVIGKLPITSSQAQKLELKPHSQLSPYLEACCLRSKCCGIVRTCSRRRKICHWNRSLEKCAATTGTPSKF